MLLKGLGEHQEARHLLAFMSLITVPFEDSHRACCIVFVKQHYLQVRRSKVSSAKARIDRRGGWPLAGTSG